MQEHVLLRPIANDGVTLPVSVLPVRTHHVF